MVVGLLVDADGKVAESKIVSSSGHPRLDRASAKASAQCRFKPAKATQGWTKVRYTWVID